MGWFKDIFKGKHKQPENNNNLKYAETIDGYSPIFSQFGKNIYASDVVQQALNCIVLEMKKLNPKHIVISEGMENIAMRTDINAILNIPNELMTTSDFIEKVIWLLFFNYNAFIYPTYYTYTDEKGNKKRYYTGLYPLNPTQVDFLRDSSDELFIRLRFVNNYEVTLPYSDIIHIRRNFSVNEFMGGNETGNPDYDALLETLNLNKTLLDSVSYSAKTGLKIQGVIKYGSIIGQEALEKARQEFEDALNKNKNGILPLDMKGEFIPIQRNLKLVDKDTLDFIDQKILRYFGVPIAILTGDYTKQQYEAFYQKTLEPLIISLSQAFTKTFFSQRERAFGNEIRFYPEDLIFLTNEQKLELVKEAGGRGAFTNNQILRMFGLPPYEGGDIRLMSLNYVDVEIANQYQLNRASGSIKETGGEGNGEATNE